MNYPVMLARVVGAGLASPVELRTTWKIADVFDALDSLSWSNWRQRTADKAASEDK